MGNRLGRSAACAVAAVALCAGPALVAAPAAADSAGPPAGGAGAGPGPTGLAATGGDATTRAHLATGGLTLLALGAVVARTARRARARR
ncbi:hypothetical protein ACRAR1_04610 [Streptomyces sanyensis]|uniref:hypothetical protein n=1 Tax=Streptomyces sanyensis TaxID=568869 RepID=UPI003D77E74C